MERDVFALSDDIAMRCRVHGEEHKAILDMSMLLHSLGTRDRGDAVVETALACIEELVEGHCLREESAMRAANYPQADQHAALHTLFRQHLRERVDPHRHCGQILLPVVIGLGGTAQEIDGALLVETVPAHRHLPIHENAVFAQGAVLRQLEIVEDGR
nr:hypothetical protein [Paramagnetospirillum kuznetsovii]